MRAACIGITLSLKTSKHLHLSVNTQQLNMEQPQQKSSTLDKLILAVTTITEHQEEIMNSGTIPPQIWDEILHLDVLGLLCPTTVLAQAFLTQLKLMQDELLRDTIWEYITSSSAPKRTKATNAKEWFEALKKQAIATPMEPSRHLERTSAGSSPTTLVNLMDKMKIEVKLPIYDGSPDTCMDCRLPILCNWSYNKCAKEAITMLETNTETTMYQSSRTS